MGLSSVEPFFNQPELPLEGRIIFQQTRPYGVGHFATLFALTT